jgi:hypothetical protein
VGLRAPGMFMELFQTHRCKDGRHPGGAFPRAAPNSRSSVMAAANLCPSRCGNAGTSVPVASPPSATSTRRFWLATSNHQSIFPRVPNRGTPPVGKVGNPACAHAYEQACQRASARQPLPCSVTYPRRPSASASKSKPSDTRARLPLKADGKRGSKARNLRGFSPERSQSISWWKRIYARTCPSGEVNWQLSPGYQQSGSIRLW